MRKKELIKRIEELEKENRELKHKDAQMYFFMERRPEIKKEFEKFCEIEKCFFLHLLEPWILKV